VAAATSIVNAVHSAAKKAAAGSTLIYTALVSGDTCARAPQTVARAVYALYLPERIQFRG
jgi:hypothetical protein